MIEQDAVATLSTSSFIGTKVQVQGIDKPDDVKTDGLNIFVSTASAVPIAMHIRLTKPV